MDKVDFKSRHLFFVFASWIKERTERPFGIAAVPGVSEKISCTVAHMKNELCFTLCRMRCSVLYVLPCLILAHLHRLPDHWLGKENRSTLVLEKGADNSCGGLVRTANQRNRTIDVDLPCLLYKGTF